MQVEGFATFILHVLLLLGEKKRQENQLISAGMQETSFQVKE